MVNGEKKSNTQYGFLNKFPGFINFLIIQSLIHKFDVSLSRTKIHAISSFSILVSS